MADSTHRPDDCKLRARLAARARARLRRRSASPASSWPRTRRISSDWLGEGHHGDMDYMARHGGSAAVRRNWCPGRCASSRCAWTNGPPGAAKPEHCSAIGARAYVARYALGRDYHKILRARLAKLARGLQPPSSVRSATAPSSTRRRCMEKRARAQRRPRLDRQEHEPDQRARRLAVLARRAVHRPAAAGRCARQAITAAAAAPASRPARPARSSAPYQLDARRCISYLTIEHHGDDPGGAASGDRQPHVRLRRLPAGLPLEQVRAGRGATRIPRAPRARRARLVGLFGWTEAEYLDAQRRQRAAPARLPALAAQHRGRARQRAARRRSVVAALAAARDHAGRARARARRAGRCHAMRSAADRIDVVAAAGGRADGFEQVVEVARIVGRIDLGGVDDQ